MESAGTTRSESVERGRADETSRTHGERVRGVDAGTRIDGKVCLVTGASSGIGKAIAIALAARGGRVILACRSRDEATLAEIERQSGSSHVELAVVDLADLRSVDDFCDTLRDRGTRLDIAVLNAGLLPRTGRQTPQGFEQMFAVHFLANRLLLARWLADGVIVPDAQPGKTPRVVFVVSEAHRSVRALDLSRFGAFVPYGLREGMTRYGETKLYACLLATELSRRLNPGASVQVAVSAVSPGATATRITRESPALLRLALWPLQKLLFRSPEHARESAVYLACAPEAGARSGVYLHGMRERAMSPLALDPGLGERVWSLSEALLQTHRTSATRA